MRKIIQNNYHLEKGQVIPILVIGILVTVMMAALLIDGGMVISHRRTAQAAADAGALAAVKSLCPGSGGTNADARAVATAFVEDNNAEFILLPDEEQFPEDHTIRVEARAASQAFFGGIFDQLGLSANAIAEANCAAAGAEGVVLGLPVAYPCLDAQIEDGEIIGCGNINPGDKVIVMDSDKTYEHCFDPADNPGGVICTEPDKKKNSSRGWLSLTGGNLDSCWVNGNCSTPPPAISSGTWLRSVTGNRTSFYNNTLKSHVESESTFIVGIYDQETNGRACTCNNGVCVDGDFIGEPCILSNGNQNSYRIVGFAEITLTCVATNHVHDSCPFRASLGITGSNNNTVEGKFETNFFTTGGDGASGQYIVQLTQ